MLHKEVLGEIGSKVSEILEHSPAKDVEKNLKVVLSGVFSQLNLVTREEFDVQEKVLLRAREKLITLESKVAKLEEQLGLFTSDSAATVAPGCQSALKSFQVSAPKSFHLAW